MKSFWEVHCGRWNRTSQGQSRVEGFPRPPSPPNSHSHLPSGASKKAPLPLFAMWVYKEKSAAWKKAFISPCWCPDLASPAWRTIRNKFLLLISHQILVFGSSTLKRLRHHPILQPASHKYHGAMHSTNTKGLLYADFVPGGSWIQNDQNTTKLMKARFSLDLGFLEGSLLFLYL